MANEIEIHIKGTDQSGPAQASARDNARKTATEVQAAMDRVGRATKDAGEAAARYGRESGQARAAAAEQARAETGLAEAVDRAGRAEREEAAAARAAGAAAGQAGDRVRRFSDQADSAGRSSGRFHDGLARVGQVAAGFLAANVIGRGFQAAGDAIRSTIAIGIDYQSQLNTLQAVTHATGEQMAQVARKARDLGNDLSLPATSAGDAAKAMTELTKGNLSVQQAMDAAKGTLQLAAAAQIDGAQAATIEADALNAFALKATLAGHVSDVLANAANSATGEISDFALGLAASGAVAHQFGISLDNTVTALALFANAGIHSSDAGTSLKSALLALAHPSDQAAGALKTLGVHAFDAHGRFVGLEAISQQLADAQGRLSQKAFVAATATAFGSDAARAAGVLAGAGAAGWDKMAASIGKSGGASQAAAAQMKGVGGAIAGIQSEIETIKIDVFTRAAPVLERFLHAVAGGIPKAIDAITAGFKAGAPPAAAFANGLRGVVDTGLKPMGQVIDAVDRGLAPIGGLFDKLGGAGAGMVKGLAPVKPVLAGIGAAGKGASDVFTSMGPIIGETATLMGDAVKPIGPLIRAAGTEASKSNLEKFFYGLGRAVAEVILFVRRNADTWQDWGHKIGQAAGVAAGLIRGLIGFGKDLVKYKGWIEPIAAGILAVVAAYKIWRTATLALTVAQAALDVVLAANPIGIVVLAVIGLAAAFAVAYRRSETFREIVSKALLVIVPLAIAVVSPILAIAAALRVAWTHSTAFRNAITSAFRGAATVVLAAARFIVDAVLDMVIGVLHAAGRMPGPLGAPFRAAEKSVRAFKDSTDRALSAAQARVDAFGRAAARPIRKDVTVRVIDRATGTIRTIQREIDQITGKAVSIQVGYVRGNLPQARATGGITGAAGGGPRSRLTMVGEYGRELVDLAPGSRVHSNPDTERMLAAAGAGGGNTYNINVTVAPGGHPAEVGGQIVDLIRRYEQRSGTRWRTA